MFIFLKILTEQRLKYGRKHLPKQEGLVSVK